MKRDRILLILLSLALLSFAHFSTFARFTDEYAGFDSALVAKWNFGAMGEDDGGFYNKGFTFDLFDADSVKPMDYGRKSFTFTGGGSDTGILYDVEMNIRDLLWLAKGTVAKKYNVDIYAPFIFRVTATINGASINEEAVDDAPFVFSPFPGAAPDDPGDYDSGWFRPGDIEASERIGTDEDGYFSIFDRTKDAPCFSPGSKDQVTITVYWQWNTSFYINDTGAAGTGIVPIEPNATEGSGGKLSYYQTAYGEYYGSNGLNDLRIAAAWDVMDYLATHSSLPGGRSCDPDGNGQEGGHTGEEGTMDPEEPGGAPTEPDPESEGEPVPPNNGGTGEGDPEAIEPEGLDDGFEVNVCLGDGFEDDDDNGFDYEYYNSLVEAEHAAIEACETSLLAAYDDYDTLAVNALVAKGAVKVIFRIRGEQVSPGIIS